LFSRALPTDAFLTPEIRRLVQLAKLALTLAPHEFEETLGDFDGFLLGLNLKQRETDLVALADSALQI